MLRQDSAIAAQQFRCTLILPTYNAAGFIRQSVARVTHFLRRYPKQWCALFICDGCTDDTVQELAARIDPDDPQIKVVTRQANRGKGRTLVEAFNLCQTPYLVYTDVDLAYDPEEATKVLHLLEDGADVALANRAHAESEFLIRPPDFPNIYKRHVMSRCFNWWLRQMLPIRALDTQAGLKGLTAHAWKLIAPQIASDGFFFDVELLAWAGMRQLRIAETPVAVRYIDPTTVRMLTHGWQMIKDTLRLRRSMRDAARLSIEEAETPAPQPITQTRSA